MELLLFQPRLLALARPVRWHIGLSALLQWVALVTRLAQALLLARGVVEVLEGPSPALTPIVAGLLAAVVVRLLCLWGVEVVAQRTGHAIQRSLRARLYEHLLKLGPGYASGRRTGELRTLMVDHVQALEPYCARFLPAAVLLVLGPLTVLAVLLTVDAWLTVIALAVVVFALVAPRLYRVLFAKREVAVFSEIARLDSEFVDTFQGLPTVKAFSATGQRRAALTALAERVRRALMTQFYVLFVAGVLQRLAMVGGVVAVVACAALWRLDAAGVFGALAVLFAVPELFRPLEDLSKHLLGAFGAIAAAGQVQATLEAKPLPTEPARPVDTATLTPSIRVDRVTFTYPGRSQPALSDVSFTVEAGQTVAVVGRSGSGKSTVVSLLLRFFDPHSGRILLGNQDLRTLPPGAVHDMVAVVSQDTYLFHGTIHDNIAMGRADATEADVQAAAAEAGLAEFIAQLPDGYDTQVGERGVQLSGGQRQRIAIARALLKNAPILVLDEATSSVDAASEAAIQAALEEITRGRTTLVIAHRLSTVRNADQLVVLEDGRVSETGTAAELLARGGSYARLVATQEGAAR